MYVSFSKNSLLLNKTFIPTALIKTMMALKILKKIESIELKFHKPKLRSAEFK